MPVLATVSINGFNIKQFKRREVGQDALHRYHAKQAVFDKASWHT